MNAISRLPAAAERGEPHAAYDLLPLVYDELHRLAASRPARKAPIFSKKLETVVPVSPAPATNDADV
jgi:hypothetical protein